MRISLASGTPAELALPDGPCVRGVVVHPDIMGLRPLFDRLCAHLAKEHSWAVCAPEPFSGQEHLSREERQEALAELDDEHQLGDLVAAADATGADRVAVMGFCMGGMYALKAAGWENWDGSGGRSRFDRAVSFYGMIKVPEQWQGPGQDEPLDYVSRPGACPVLALLGGQDPWTPPDDIAELDALSHVEVVIYPHADHGFVHDPDRPTHRPADAADAWQRVAAFLSD